MSEIEHNNDEKMNSGHYLLKDFLESNSIHLSTDRVEIKPFILGSLGETKIHVLENLTDFHIHKTEQAEREVSEVEQKYLQKINRMKALQKCVTFPIALFLISSIAMTYYDYYETGSFYHDVMFWSRELLDYKEDDNALFWFPALFSFILGFAQLFRATPKKILAPVGKYTVTANPTAEKSEQTPIKLLSFESKKNAKLFEDMLKDAERFRNQGLPEKFDVDSYTSIMIPKSYFSDRTTKLKWVGGLMVVLFVIPFGLKTFYSIDFSVESNHTSRKSQRQSTVEKENGEIPGYKACVNNLGKSLGNMTMNEATCYCCSQVGGKCRNGRTASSMKVCYK